jgi:hypothetical protein
VLTYVTPRYALETLVNNIPELLRKSFNDFYIHVFYARNPGAELIDGPVQRYICDTYQNLDQGDRLVVNQPPRTGKSLTALAYALWRIGRDPTEKIVFLSNNIPLAQEHVYEARKIMRSAEYQEIFPKTRIAKDGTAITRLRTTRGGRFFLPGPCSLHSEAWAPQR